uniref:Uncharacterized protein n=1 Tax=Schlesneria paludicola TaxID=360056 RepID=A0A7C2P8N4_9PLAN
MLGFVRSSSAVLLAASVLSTTSLAQVIVDDGPQPWGYVSEPGWGGSRLTPPFGDHWQPRRPPLGPVYGGYAPWFPAPVWGEDCCLPVADPCCELDAGEPLPAPSSPQPGGAIPIPAPLDADPEYVPRNKPATPTPIQVPDDPNWHPIPGTSVPNPGVPNSTAPSATSPGATTNRPGSAAPPELPAEIEVPAPREPEDARRLPPRTSSSRFVPVPTAARVWQLR